MSLYDNNPSLKILINPASGNGKGKKLLTQSGDWIAQATQPSNIIKQVEDFLQPGNTLLIAGGDGTIHMVINALVTLNLHQEITLSILPLGTGNDLANAFNSKKMTLQKKIKQISSSKKTQTLPIWKVNNHVFVNYLSWGVDAEILAKVDRWRKRFPKNAFINNLLYAIAGFLSLFNFRQSEITINNKLISCYCAIFSNLHVYGGGSIVGTEETTSQPELNFVIIQSKLQLIKLLLTRLTKKPFKYDLQKEKNFIIKTTAKSQLDGEINKALNSNYNIEYIGKIKMIN